ncbi:MULTISPECIES: lasso RiPP family leader peptide-containing protein [unclassified Streptomyces]|nr:MULTISPECIES: lasso RiPP family leader peptide-containing protein [unclassified Streptomyces]THC45157.1 lasso RiPP family leader peptide-containing protein [Streptomyces sp. A1499]
MQSEKLVYDMPMIVEVGGFRELTRSVRPGHWIDFFGGWWL